MEKENEFCGDYDSRGKCFPTFTFLSPEQVAINLSSAENAQQSTSSSWALISRSFSPVSALNTYTNNNKIFVTICHLTINHYPIKNLSLKDLNDCYFATEVNLGKTTPKNQNLLQFICFNINTELSTIKFYNINKKN